MANCQVHPAYCAHSSDDWLESHGIHGPDCARLSLQNFQNYLYDIDPWGSKRREYIERWLICVCNHPFRPKEGIAFSACKENIDNVFYQIANMTDYEKCLLVNNATALIGDDLTLCESQKTKETTMLSQVSKLEINIVQKHFVALRYFCCEKGFFHIFHFFIEFCRVHRGDFLERDF